ncbi:MAG: 23S rRNA (guanosine(2251)-2'-O)-methyltransferase RlmB, partial [Myxococcota bacterium]
DLDLVAALSASDGRPALLIALDGVRDPHNLGAIVRSAYLFGADGVIITRDRAAQITPAVVKVSAGATEHLPIARATNLVRALEELKQAGLWLVGMSAGAQARPIDEIDGAAPLCLVMGAEGSGLRKLVARTCDFQAVIPMGGAGVGSFNVSVAAAVALYEITRQRRAGAAG